jgi:hypothetical protein
LAKCPKVLEKRGTKPAKVSGACAEGGVKRPSGVDIVVPKSAKLRKGIISRAIASMATACITPEERGSLDSLGALGSKTGGRDRSSKTVPGAKKVTPSAKKHIVLVIGALATISSEGTQESSPRD